MHLYIYMYMYCRASHTGDATRVMYSSVSAGVVHVLGACAQVRVSRVAPAPLPVVLPSLLLRFLG